MDLNYFLTGNLSEKEKEICLEHKKNSKRYNRCIQRLKESKKLSTKINSVFDNLKYMLAWQQQIVKEKLSYVPAWLKSFFTIENFIQMMKTVPKQFDMPEFATSEMVLNFIFYCASFGVSWSQYFLVFKEGRDILYNAFFKNELVSILAFTEAVYMVGITKSYDEGIFRKELYASFPDIEKYLYFDPSQSGIYRTIALFVFGKISFAIFKESVLRIASYLKKTDSSSSSQPSSSLPLKFRFKRH